MSTAWIWAAIVSLKGAMKAKGQLDWKKSILVNQQWMDE